METVIDLDIPPHEPLLVLNGLLDTDTNVRVFVSHSVGAFSNDTLSYLEDASVFLYRKNGNQFDLVEPLYIDSLNPIDISYQDDGWNSYFLSVFPYVSDYVPQKNSTYKIEVDHSDYPSISAETYIPDDILIYDIDVDTTLTDKVRLDFSFNDDPTQDNYYRLKIFASCTKEFDDYWGYEDEWDYKMQVDFASNDPSFPSTGIPFDGYSFEGNFVVFSDALFNGQQKNISLDVYEGEYEYQDCDTVIIEFSNFSDDTYSYYNSLGDHADKGELGLFGGEVIPVYTNVENGLGVLISTNAQQIYIRPVQP